MKYKKSYQSYDDMRVLVKITTKKEKRRLIS